MGIGSRDREVQEAALRPRIVRTQSKSTYASTTKPTRETVWGANIKHKKTHNKPYKDSPLPELSGKKGHKEKDGDGLGRKLGRGVMLLTLGVGIPAVAIAGGYVLSQELKTDGVDINAETPKEGTSNTYYPVSAGASNGIPPATVAPVAVQPQPAQAETPLNTIVALPATTAPIANPEASLPNPLTFSTNAGSVVCTGEVITVPITADTRQFVALANATGEPWNQGVAPHNDDEALFSELLIANGYPTGTPPPPPYTLAVRNGCTGLEQ